MSPSTPSPLRMRASNAAFSGFAKLASVSCCPARSMRTRSEKPRSVARWLVLDWRSCSAPISTPLSFPATSRVGTAMITTRCWPTLVTSPSLMYGFPVAITALKYARSATFDPEPFGKRSETRELPSRSIQPRPPVNVGCAPSFCTRLKYVAIRALSWSTTDGDAGDRAQGRDLAREVRVEDGRGEHDAGAHVVERLVLCVVVLAPGEERPEHDEDTVAARALAAMRRLNVDARRPKTASRPPPVSRWPFSCGGCALMARP